MTATDISLRVTVLEQRAESTDAQLELIVKTLDRVESRVTKVESDVADLRSVVERNHEEVMTAIRENGRR